MAPLAPLLPLEEIAVVGLAGAGSVGTAWAALLLYAEFDVVVFDPDPQAPRRVRAGVEAAWDTFRQLRQEAPASPPLARLRFVETLEALAADSDLVQENVTEAIDVKGKVISEIDRYLAPDRLILSSSGGVPPTRMQEYCVHPERLVLGHPFHPAHVIPLVEVLGGDRTRPDAVVLAKAFYQKLGKRPIVLLKERVGHLSNRLQFALLREAINCLNEGVASADDIDAAVRWGLGLRWALMGPLMTLNLAGGDGGIEQILSRFKGDVELWWASLGQPTLTPDVCESLRKGVEQLRGDRSNAEWSKWRDEQLIELLTFRQGHPYPDETAVDPSAGSANVAVSS
ncbi:3-hydroxyacyl-CoA dehydrogenase NAD-binding domain-containing protein [Tardiphaga sp. 709]|uniref:3-hydroxyacyl-CoA dehydrogenase NAD-binding domain-containing protein n=1 Tax=Tardiphaga sp. 709 TaxID=3076039 RepID=UPI0028EA3AE6|nr:3-hydroxyacyl-CoA dehydrogenase NAD-binding domain-containing protein [Tardiphaga sp. 709]WNV11751.1 3-hydroxyacyl-CoA dehydrogenase NAD-binding domain-containing protein [Tardiphaga sp. 709]